MNPAAALLALSLAFPGSAALLRLDTITVLIDAARAHRVPAPVLLAIAWLESRCGTAPRYASLTGVRVHHAYVPGHALAADIAARSLSRRIAECGSLPRGLVAYRWGRGCMAADPTGYSRRVLTLARRLGGAP